MRQHPYWNSDTISTVVQEACGVLWRRTFSAGAVAPLLKLVAALDRYHGPDVCYQRLAPPLPPDEEPRLKGPPAPPLAHQAALPEPDGDASVDDFSVIDRY